MDKKFCDRCGREINIKTKHKFMGIVSYDDVQDWHYISWDKKYEVCDECGKQFKKWLRNRK